MSSFTTDAMERLEALMKEKLEAEEARKKSGLDPDTFEVFWFLQHEQIKDPLPLAKASMSVSQTGIPTTTSIAS